MSTPEERLHELGIELPTPAAPAAAYVPTVRAGDLLYVSGQLPLVSGTLTATGLVGGEVSFDEAVRAARQCAINLLAVLRAELGELARVRRVVRLTGFVATGPGFRDQHRVINGASELLGEVLGEAGRHSRSAVGVAALPLDAPVEVDGIVEVG